MSENSTPLTTEHLRIMRDDIAQFRADITKKKWMRDFRMCASDSRMWSTASWG